MRCGKSSMSRMYNKHYSRSSSPREMTDKQKQYLEFLEGKYKIKVLWETITSSSVASHKIKMILKAVEEGNVQLRITA